MDAFQRTTDRLTEQFATFVEKYGPDDPVKAKDFAAELHALIIQHGAVQVQHLTDKVVELYNRR